jgi:hypothetical protein
MFSHRNKLRVEVVGDWSRCSRGNFWPEVLTELDRRRLVPNTTRLYPLADWTWHPAPGLWRQQLVRVPGESLLQHLDCCDVLILNWDVANGDPDFGADLAMRWFSHRRPEILHWVRERGGILIIEGEARLGVPAQASYDAVLGQFQVQVCGEADALRPRRQVERNGTRCKMTNAARFPALADTSAAPFIHLQSLTARQRSFDDMFPGTAGLMLSPFLSTGDWQLLYRGWFRWNPFRRKRMPWVPFAKTADRKFNHPTMLVAKHGTGAVFVSTMFLASSNQLQLVEAMLRCHGDVARLPDPPRRVLFVRKWILSNVVPLIAAVAALLLGRQLGWDQAVGGNEVLRLGFLALLALAVAIVAKLRHRLASFVREVTGR